MLRTRLDGSRGGWSTLNEVECVETKPRHSDARDGRPQRNDPAARPDCGFAAANPNISLFRYGILKGVNHEGTNTH